MIDCMTDLFAAVSTRRPAEVEERGGERFLSLSAALELLDDAERNGVQVFGLEGFLITDTATYPALGRIADYSRASPSEALSSARQLLTHEWSLPPRASEDQMHPDAAGRHMIAVVLAR